ncbi:AT-hook motif nuclear-localized protein 10 [Quillaja saponaria]|uniref:AT-hook motif nuclear-localized protein 10 n=1 Tax=Quillaja saponaria TaxID=32244 RepID=A0AAD7PDR8_QUISA|nr:AT-hook motif nuclear-localized protein 10 [Quillaja saponaria]
MVQKVFNFASTRSGFSFRMETRAMEDSKGLPGFLPPGWDIESEEMDDGTEAKCYKNLESGKKFYSLEHLFYYVAYSIHEDAPKPFLQEGSAKEPPPLRMYWGDGPRLHALESIRRNFFRRCCDDCGDVGNMTCFSGGFRKWALRRAKKEDRKLKCTRCGDIGHVCLTCPLPIVYKWPTRCNIRRPRHCGICGERGHDGRTCPQRQVTRCNIAEL